MADLKKYFRRSWELNIDFNYTLNSTCLGGTEFTLSGRRRLLEFVSMLVELGVRTFTVTIPSLVPIIKERFEDISICSSLICEVDSVPAARIFESLGFDRLIIDDAIVRRFDIIAAIRRNLRIPLETLVNNTCLFNCPWKSFHYGLLSHSNRPHHTELELYYHWQCMQVRTLKPAELLRLRWIRPEDITAYNDIKYFKVVGRYHATQSDLRGVARSYASLKFKGNLWDLLGNFAPQRRHGIVIDNQKLDGFLNRFLDDPVACDDRGCNGCFHCTQFAKKAVDSHSLKNAAEQLKLDRLSKRIDHFHRFGRPLHLDEEKVFQKTMGVTI